MKKLFVFAVVAALIFVVTACANNSDSGSGQFAKTDGEGNTSVEIQPAAMFLSEQTDESLSSIAAGLDSVRYAPMKESRNVSKPAASRVAVK